MKRVIYYSWKYDLPVVKAGVHSCSPVAPHNRVKLFEGSTVTKGPAAVCKEDPFRLPKIRAHSESNFILRSLDFNKNYQRLFTSIKMKILWIWTKIRSCMVWTNLNLHAWFFRFVLLCFLCMEKELKACPHHACIPKNAAKSA